MHAFLVAHTWPCTALNRLRFNLKPVFYFNRVVTYRSISSFVSKSFVPPCIVFYYPWFHHGAQEAKKYATFRYDTKVEHRLESFTVGFSSACKIKLERFSVNLKFNCVPERVVFLMEINIQ